MAHYMALRGSRFEYSHEHSYVPADGVLSILDDADMIMRFRSVGGKQVVYHSAMNYLFRPKEMEHYCLYELYQKVYFTSLNDAEKLKVEYFEFLGDHPMSSVDVAIYRTHDCVPVFPWNWLGSTKNFSTSILHPVNEADPDYHKREEYAKRFMILFLPFRTDNDLKIDGSYQKALQTAHSQHDIKEEMIQIAENIMTLQNSLESALVENPLKASTVLEESEEVTQEEKEDDDTATLMASIGHYFASTAGGNLNLTEDAVSLSPKFAQKSLQEKRFSVPVAPLDDANSLEDVISLPSELASNEKADTDPPEERFHTSTSELNTLAMTQFLVQEEDSVPNARKIIYANGSWKSVVAWGKEAKLDAEQQTAFEILAATYVLTFYDEAIHIPTMNDEEFKKQKKSLCTLARRQLTLDKPLRMFITGPAGAGKCT